MKEDKEESQKKISELQVMEQRLQGLIMQKQNLQSQSLEIENALVESNDSEEVYKITGQIMIKTNKDKLIKELKEKKELLDKRVDTIEKQEEKLRENLLPLQEEIMCSLKKNG